MATLSALRTKLKQRLGLGKHTELTLPSTFPLTSAGNDETEFDANTGADDATLDRAMLIFKAWQAGSDPQLSVLVDEKSAPKDGGTNARE